MSVLLPKAILPAPDIEPKVRSADNVKLPPDVTLKDIEPVFENTLVLDSVYDTLPPIFKAVELATAPLPLKVKLPPLILVAPVRSIASALSLPISHIPSILTSFSIFLVIMLIMMLMN